MRVLVCGDRKWKDRRTIRASLNILVRVHKLAGYEDDLIIVEGGAPGADTIAREEAEKLDLTIEEYPAEWSRYGRAAGPKRNQQMLKTGIDFAMAFHPYISNSRGTKDMVRKLRKAGVLVKLVEGRDRSMMSQAEIDRLVAE